VLTIPRFQQHKESGIFLVFIERIYLKMKYIFFGQVTDKFWWNLKKEKANTATDVQAVVIIKGRHTILLNYRFFSIQTLSVKSCNILIDLKNDRPLSLIL